MFRGHAYRTLDTKGRLILPPEFREIVLSQDEGGRIMLTNLDGCVVGYTYPQWLELEQSFNEINLLNRRLRDFQRFFYIWGKRGGHGQSGEDTPSPTFKKVRQVK